MKLWDNSKTCRRCHREFKGTYGKRHIYCSAGCRQAAYRERQPNRQRQPGKHRLAPV